MLSLFQCRSPFIRHVARSEHIHQRNRVDDFAELVLLAILRQPNIAPPACLAGTLRQYRLVSSIKLASISAD